MQLRAVFELLMVSMIFESQGQIFESSIVHNGAKKIIEGRLVEPDQRYLIIAIEAKACGKLDQQTIS